MKNRLKSYLVFTSLMYRILMYLAIPVILVGIVFMAERVLGSAAIVLGSVLLTVIEIVSDYWLFGGIQTKDAEKMEFLKTSGCGMNIIRNALGLDLIRKLVTTVIVLGICYFAFSWTNGGSGYGMFQNAQAADENLQMAMYGVSVSWFFSVLGTFLTRYGSMLWFNVMVGYGMILCETACWSLLEWEKHFVLYSLLYLALGIGGSLLAVKAAMKKVEGGYYDK